MRLLLMVCWFYCALAMASDNAAVIHLQQASLTQVIRLLAKMANINVVIDPAVQGVVNLQWQGEPSIAALDGLLATHGLARHKSGAIWFIAPRDALEAALPLNLAVFHLHYARAQDAAELLQTSNADFISKRGSMRVDARTNTLFMRDNATKVALVRQLLASLDVPIQQIRIEVRIANVDADHACDLGIRYATTTPWQEEQHAVATLRLPGGAWLDAKLSALERDGHAHLISRPSLFTANQQPASIEAGEEIPYQEVSESGGTAVVFKKAVLALKVTPYVMPGGQLRLHMQINQDRPSDKLVHGVPTISTRQIITEVSANSGETIVLGGIYEMSDERGYSGLPFLSKIPIVGSLFRDTQSRQTRRELLIFVTPKLMNTAYAN